MVNVTEFKRGNWLKVGDVKTGDLITFKNEGEIIDDNFNEGKKKLEFLFELSDGSEIQYAPNRQSISALSEVWGDEAANWIGKQAIVEIKSEIIQGEDKNFIVLTPNDDGATDPDPTLISQDEIPVIGEKAEEEPKKKVK